MKFGFRKKARDLKPMPQQNAANQGAKSECRACVEYKSASVGSPIGTSSKAGTSAENQSTNAKREGPGPTAAGKPLTAARVASDKKK
jgi:hypothetical protein